MMQPAGGMAPPPMIPPPMDQQQQQQYQMPQQPQYQMPPPQQYQMPPAPAPQYQMPPPAMMAPPQYQQPPPMWGQQPSQIPPPQPVPVPQQMQPQYPATTGEIRTLWIGDLQYWMDENYVTSCFPQTGEILSLKLIRNKQTGQLEGYGFIEFSNRAAAERILQSYTGQLMPNTEQPFRLNWASLSAGDRRGDDGTDYTIFVGDLAADVTDYVLQETFRPHYSSVKGAKVVTDRATGHSKGYGFVRFGDANEQARALTEMNGTYCTSRPMRIGAATTKKNMGTQQYSSTKPSYQSTQGPQSENDPNNTTIFVGGLDSNVTEELLQQLFSSYGELVHVKIPAGKRCGFVQFANRASAEEALQVLQGTQLGGQNIRLSWGRSPNKQQQQNPNQWNNGSSYYGYGQGGGYETYGYAQPPQDPNMYAYGAYPGYGGGYQQQQ